MPRSFRGSVVAVAAGVALAGSLVSGVAFATHDIPAKAKAISAELVKAYTPCTAPDTGTIAFPVPACDTVTPRDTVCSFGAKGAGKVKAQSTGKGDLKFSWQVAGIEGCEGEMLCPQADVRVTVDDCPAGDCTTIDLPSFPLAGSVGTGCGVVSGGKAKGSGTVNGTFGTAISAGKGQSIELLGCGVRRTTTLGGPAPSAASFSCGILAP